jgi:hypothetical protein
MAVDDKISIDVDYNKDKLEIEGDPLEVEQPGSEEIITEFVEDEQGQMQPFTDDENPEEDFNSNLAL